MSNNTVEFRLRNIEEFDADFVQNLRVEKQQPAAPETVTPSLIPELEKNVPVNAVQTPPQKSATEIYFDNTIRPPVNPAPAQTTPRPLVPIGSGQTAIPVSQEKIGGATTPVSNPVLNFDESDFDTQEEKPKSAKGARALKIVSIILMSITIVIFLLGCLVSVFINNNGTNLAGYCFNSQLRDVTFKTDSGDVKLSKGDLIVSKSLDAAQYEKNMIVSVLAKDENGNNGCDVYSIGSVTKINSSTYDFELVEPQSGNADVRIKSNDCYGLVEYYVPVVGGVIAFTTSSILNSVLVCALFILIVAFWALLLILSEKKIKEIGSEHKN